MNQKTLYLIDGSGFLFRAYFALPMLNREDGTPVNAVMGFCNMLYKLQNEIKAEYAAVIFDAGRKTFRNEIYSDYKAHRAPTPPDLAPQYPLVREASRAFGFPTIELEGYEADDLIATYARMATQQGYNVIIVSSDKDLMQLVNSEVVMLDPLKNTRIDAQAVFQKFGVWPNRVIDVQALAGDTADNVPGAPGIGVKTAAQFINEYGDLENLLANAGHIKGKKGEVLQTHAEQIRMSKRLVTLEDNAPVTVHLDELAIVPPDNLDAFLRSQDFYFLLSKMEKDAVT